VNPALIAVLAIMAAKRKVAECLLAEGATMPERARPLSEDDLRLAGDLVGEGVLREAAPGRYYVDEAAFAAWSQPGGDPRAMRRVTVGIGLALLVALALALLLLLLTR
jgi:hypothetical protein